MRSRQFEHLQQASLKRLQDMVPHDCPIVVTRGTGGFIASAITPIKAEGLERTSYSARFEVVAAFITGFVAAWKSRP